MTLKKITEGLTGLEAADVVYDNDQAIYADLTLTSATDNLFKQPAITSQGFIDFDGELKPDSPDAIVTDFIDATARKSVNITYNTGNRRPIAAYDQCKSFLRFYGEPAWDTVGREIVLDADVFFIRAWSWAELNGAALDIQLRVTDAVQTVDDTTTKSPSGKAVRDGLANILTTDNLFKQPAIVSQGYVDLDGEVNTVSPDAIVTEFIDVIARKVVNITCVSGYRQPIAAYDRDKNFLRFYGEKCPIIATLEVTLDDDVYYIRAWSFAELEGIALDIQLRIANRPAQTIEDMVDAAINKKLRALNLLR